MVNYIMALEANLHIKQHCFRLYCHLGVQQAFKLVCKPPCGSGPDTLHQFWWGVTGTGCFIPGHRPSLGSSPQLEASFQNTKASTLCLSARPDGFRAQNVKSWCVGTTQRLGKAASRPGPAGWAFKAFQWLSSAVGLAVLNFYFCVFAWALSIYHFGD